MNKPHKGILGKLLALFLALTVCLAPAANALTADQLKTLLQEYYLDGVSDAVLHESTIEGILNVLDDPYTDYMTAEEYEAFLNSMSDQEIGGIGISATAVEKGLLILSLHKNSPAEAAGLEAGNIITAVNGNAAAGKSAEAITQWLKGEPDTKVVITVLHQNGDATEYSLIRKLIVIPATTSQLIDEHVGYINCKAFGGQTLTHFLEAFEEHKQAKIWMVDLRSNLGGDVYVASQTLGTFLGRERIAYLRDGKEQYVLYQSDQQAETIYPTIVLTSAWTASAAEIFSGVIRDKQQGLLVGEKTFGKGVAQVLLNADQFPLFFSNGDALKVTAFRYFTTSGSTADQVGIIPHLMVNSISAGDIALLLTEEEPKSADKSNYLCMHLGKWRWYVDVKTATSEEKKVFFTQLLEAIPPNATIKQGTQSGGWIDITVEDLVENYQLDGYQSRGFSDVNGSDFEDQINTLATYGIVKGSEGLYFPHDSLTRAELSALLVQALGLSSKRTDSMFSDVDVNAWYADEVNAVYASGLMKGISEDQFWPEGTVTEEQLITVLARVGTQLNAYLYEKAKEWSPEQNSVPDSYSSWARKWVWLLSDTQKEVLGRPINLLYNAADRIDPQDTASRAETAALLYSILKYIKILPV